MRSRQKVIALGVTGSVGQTFLEVIRKFPDLFELVGFSYHRNFELAAKIQKEFKVRNVCKSRMTDDDKSFWKANGCAVYDSLESLINVDHDALLAAVVGAAGAKSVFKASAM